MSSTKFEQIIGNPRIFKMILDEVMHDWPGSYDIMPVESAQDREIKDYEKFAKFCQKVRSNEEGLRRCMKCDLDYSRAAGKSGKPMHYLCHAGLMDIAVPIVVEGELIATIFCGQHRTKDAKVEKNAVTRTKKTEIDLGFKQGELLKLRAKTPALSYDMVSDVQEKLLEVATYVSNLGSSKLEAERTRKELSIRLRETDSIQRILFELSEVIDDVGEFWKKLGVILEKICKIIGADFGLFVTCEEKYPSGEAKGLVRSVANLPENLNGQNLFCSPIIGKALSEMIPVSDVYSSALFSGNLVDEINKFFLVQEDNEFAIVPVRLDPDKEGAMIFFISEAKDEASGLEIRDELSLLTQAGTHIARAYGSCLVFSKQKELSEIQSDWLENVSHQILAPINEILGQTENLSRSFRKWQKTNPQRIDNTLVTLVELSDWATRLARNFAWVARSQMQPRDLNLRLEDDMSGKLIGYARNVQGLAKTKSIYWVHVVKESVGQLNGRTAIDNKLFKQAITNLLDNAVKYASPRTEVTLTAGRSTTHGYIYITDFGIPIHKDDVERIFSRYYRTDEAKKIYSIGSGIGLGIAREIIRLHGGDLTVQPSEKSVSNWKTTFVVTLPLTKESGND